MPISSCAEGATPQANDGSTLPPLRVQPQLVPGVLVVDIGIAQKLLKMPDQVSRLLIGKDKGPRAPLQSVAGDTLRYVEPDTETDLERLTDSFHLNLTAFGLLSFFVGLFIVNSAIGLAFEQRLPMLRTLRACGVSARMLNTVQVAELVSLALLAGLAGLVCGYFIAAALLPDVAASLARTLRRANPRTVDAQAGMVARRHRHLHSGRAGRGGRESRQGDPPARAGLRPAAGLATGAAPLAEVAERSRARRSSSPPDAFCGSAIP